MVNALYDIAKSTLIGKPKVPAVQAAAPALVAPVVPPVPVAAPAQKYTPQQDADMQQQQQQASWDNYAPIPETPATPTVSEVAAATVTPPKQEVPEIVPAPITPEVPKSPETPVVVPAPETPEVPTNPGTVATPITPKVPAVPTVSETPVVAPAYSGMSTEDYNNALLAAARSGVENSANSQISTVDRNLTENLANLENEKAKVQPAYDKSIVDIGNREFGTKASRTEQMAMNGWLPNNSGLQQGEMTRIGMGASAERANAEGAKVENLSDIARRATLAQTNASNDKASISKWKDTSLSGASADALIQADSRNYGIHRDTVGDFQNDRDFGLNKDSTEANIANTNANTANTIANTDYQTLVTAGYPAEQAAKMEQAAASLKGTNLQNDYQALVNAGYPAEEALKIAQAKSTLAGSDLQNQSQAIQNEFAPQIAKGQIDNTTLQNESLAIANQYAPQIAKGQIDWQALSNAYQTLVNTNYPKEEAAKIAGILASTEGQKLSNEAQKIANQYAPQIAAGQIDGLKLQNAYQKLVNAGYNAKQAVEIAATYANIKQGNAQAAAATKNAATNAAQAALESDKFKEEKNNANASGALYSDMMKSGDPAKWLKDNGQYLTKDELSMLAPYAQPKASASSTDMKAAFKSMGYTDAEIEKMLTLK